MKAYVTTRKSLRRVLVLIDARHPVMPHEREFLDQLDLWGGHYQVPPR